MTVSPRSAAPGGQISALLAALLLAAAGLLGLSADRADASHALTLDGSLADVKHNAVTSATFVYTGDGETTNPEGRVWVAETATHYWVAFEQSKNVKSNAYCADKGKDTPNCFQDWGQLRGSDHISLMWPESAFGQQLAVSTDAIDEPDDTGPFTGAPFGIVGAGDSKDTLWGDNDFEWKDGQYEDGDGNTYSFGDSPLAGMSTLHYNHNTVGWSNLDRSPNFTSDPDDGAGYIYVSGAEYRIAKDLDPSSGGNELPDGAASTLVDTISAEAHNSPEAEVTEENPVRNIECVGFTPDEGVSVGDTTDVTFQAFENASPASGVQVLFQVTSGNATIESVADPGSATNTGLTDGDGEATATIRVNDSGTVTVQGVFDADGDGEYDQAVEETAECTLEAETSPISAEVDKTNDADRSGTFGDDETAADGPGQDVTFRVVVSNTSDVQVVIDSLRDEFPDGAADATSIDLASDSHDLIATNDCDELIDDVLEPQGTAGDEATCTFTLRGYAPAVADSPLDDRVFLQVHQVGNPSVTDTDDDDSRVRTSGDISVDLDKTNDADLDDEFTDDETADNPGQDVTFRVVVSNTSPVAVIIDALVDEFPDGAANAQRINLLDPEAPGLGDNTCVSLSGERLGPSGQDDATATCTFTVDDYAPAEGDGALVDRVTVEVHEDGDEDDTATANDDSRVRTAPGITVDLDKTNNADNQDPFSDDETAGGAGQDVTFRVMVSNTSPVAVIIDALVDEFPDGAPNAQRINLLDPNAPGLVDNTCVSLSGARLAPAEQVTCTFTVDDYAPAEADGALVDRVTVEVHEDGDEDDTATADDVSTVETDEDQGVSPDAETTAPEPAPETLPRTGAESVGLGITGSSFILVGMLLVGVAAVLDRRGQLVIVGGDGRTLAVSEFLDQQMRWARDDFRRYRQSPTTLWGRTAKQVRWARDDIRRWMSG